MEISLGRCHFGGDEPATMTGVRAGRSGWIAVCHEHEEVAEAAGYTLRRPAVAVTVAVPSAPAPAEEAAVTVTPLPDVGLGLFDEADEDAAAEVAAVGRPVPIDEPPTVPDAGALVVRVLVTGEADRGWWKDISFAQVPAVDDYVTVAGLLARVELVAWSPDHTGIAVPTAICRLEEEPRGDVLTQRGWKQP